jgi:hypothetical protein
MDLTQKLLEQWNDDEELWRRYEKLQLVFRLTTPYGVLSDDEIDNWAWLKAIKRQGPGDCIGFVVEPTR